jgi:hypothetical protein
MFTLIVILQLLLWALVWGGFDPVIPRDTNRRTVSPVGRRPDDAEGTGYSILHRPYGHVALPLPEFRRLVCAD